MFRCLRVCIAWKGCFRNDLYCVGQGIKPSSLTHWWWWCCPFCAAVGLMTRTRWRWPTLVFLISCSRESITAARITRLSCQSSGWRWKVWKISYSQPSPTWFVCWHYFISMCHWVKCLSCFVRSTRFFWFLGDHCIRSAKSLSMRISINYLFCSTNALPCD